MSDKITHDSRSKKFRVARASANEYLSSLPEFKGYHVPTWENDEKWKGLYNRDGGNKMYFGKNSDGGDNVQFLNGPEDLRNICYEIIIQSKGKYENCSSAAGWCEACIIPDGSS